MSYKKAKKCDKIIHTLFNMFSGDDYGIVRCQVTTYPNYIVIVATVCDLQWLLSIPLLMARDFFIHSLFWDQCGISLSQMVPETWDLQNVKILSIYLTMVSVPIFQHSLFPNYDLLEKKGTNVHNLAKIGLIFMNVSVSQTEITHLNKPNRLLHINSIYLGCGFIIWYRH